MRSSPADTLSTAARHSTVQAFGHAIRRASPRTGQTLHAQSPPRRRHQCPPSKAWWWGQWRHRPGPLAEPPCRRFVGRCRQARQAGGGAGCGRHRGEGQVCVDGWSAAGQLSMAAPFWLQGLPGLPSQEPACPHRATVVQPARAPHQPIQRERHTRPNSHSSTHNQPQPQPNTHTHTHTDTHRHRHRHRHTARQAGRRAPLLDSRGSRSRAGRSRRYRGSVPAAGSPPSGTAGISSRRAPPALPPTARAGRLPLILCTGGGAAACRGGAEGGCHAGEGPMGQLAGCERGQRGCSGGS
jgi:hypothetical protein